jgi:muconolactone delta-isomerase
MTRRERLAHKAALRAEWAQKATTRAAARFKAASEAATGIPFGQPILVGHHSARRHRRTIDRCWANGMKGVEETQLANRHAHIAMTLQHNLETSIYSDDPDAIEALEARAKEADAEAEKCNRWNKAWRKGGEVALADACGSAELAATTAEFMRRYPWIRQPFNATKHRNSARRDRLRIEQLRRQHAKHANPEGTPNP